MIISLLISTFITVFIAELGDKTQLATLTISGTSNKPLAVFLGSSSALVLASLLGALTGGSISTLLPEVILKSIASIMTTKIGTCLYAFEPLSISLIYYVLSQTFPFLNYSLPYIGCYNYYLWPLLINFTLLILILF